MSKLQVFKFPHPVLQQKAKPVISFDADLKRLAESMLETMYAKSGIGLAANQVGQLRQLVVLDISPMELDEADEEAAETGALAEVARDPRVFVNPRLLDSEGEVVTEEGCLSVVEFTAEVKRASKITVAYQTLEGEAREETLEDLAAVCLQHEMDHLEGKLFIDHLPLVKRQLVKKRLSKLAQSA